MASLPTVARLTAISRDMPGWLFRCCVRSSGWIRRAKEPSPVVAYHRTMSEGEKPRTTSSGVEIEPVYTQDQLSGFDLPERLGTPGAYPFTRGVHPTMYRGRLW